MQTLNKKSCLATPRIRPHQDYFWCSFHKKITITGFQAPLDTEHSLSLITREKLSCLSFTASIAGTIVHFFPSFHLPPMKLLGTSDLSNTNLIIQHEQHMEGRQGASVWKPKIPNWCGSALLPCPIVFGNPLSIYMKLVSQKAESTYLEALHCTYDRTHFSPL